MFLFIMVGLAVGLWLQPRPSHG